MNSAFAEWWISHPSLFGLPFHFWSGLLFIVGAFIGSFLNVCIHRMPLGESIVRPPSHCPHCRYEIPMFLNIPIVTWLWLRGCCANCRAPISPRYLGVEFLTAGSFLAAWLRFGDSSPATALALCVLSGLFIVATFIDFAHLIIPDEITLGGTVAGFLLSIVAPGLHGVTHVTDALKSSGLGIIVGFGLVYGIVRGGKLIFGREKILLAPGNRVVFHEDGIELPGRHIPYEEIFYRDSDTIRLSGSRVELSDRCYPEAEVSLSPRALKVGGEELPPESEPYLAATAGLVILPREAMGFGDVKFMAAIGAFLGWQATLFTIGVASLLGAVIGVTLIIVGRREWSSRLPFGPYMTVAAVIWVFGGNTWWVRMFGI